MGDVHVTGLGEILVGHPGGGAAQLDAPDPAKRDRLLKLDDRTHWRPERDLRVLIVLPGGR